MHRDLHHIKSNVKFQVSKKGERIRSVTIVVPLLAIEVLSINLPFATNPGGERRSGPESSLRLNNNILRVASVA